MSRSKTTTFLNSKTEIKAATKTELLKALERVEESNKQIRESFRSDNEALSIRAGR